MKKKSFIIRLENREQFEMLTDEQCGKLLKAMCRYADTGTAPVFNDPMLKFAFSYLKGQIDRDAVKYETMCKNNAENGKKGGRPKKTERFFEKPDKTERFFEKPTKTIPDCDCDSECDPEPDPDSECECDRDCDARAAQSEAQHTSHSTQQLSLPEIIALAKQFGYDWDMEEARSFLAYNIDKGRTKDWGFAVQKWEEHRDERKARGQKKTAASGKAQEKMQGYLSAVNRFKEGRNGSDT